MDDLRLTVSIMGFAITIQLVWVILALHRIARAIERRNSSGR